jgi:hypothetical protein
MRIRDDELSSYHPYHPYHRLILPTLLFTIRMRSMNMESTKFLDKTYFYYYIVFIVFMQMSITILFLTFLIANTIIVLVPYANASSKSLYDSGVIR